ncbi:helix-turn-helix domain-containing protein [Aureimonas sp. AU22]|jgi:XRE family transcriptional regulator, regulator of sulfur utilization|uniref:helix-turn-helix domain-containing protein n=1 Tax=Aureimonas sp. AU22 TaxID=1638162 RepID=UPI000B0F1852|nr:XRE family transcriptional regulator [Aureimonas sp. AU22]
MMSRIDPPAIGPRIRSLRKARKLTLESLAQQSGVSRSMLSEIERGEANPTYGTLWSLTRALGVDLARLLDGGAREDEEPIHLQSSHMTPTIRSADGSCTLQILSPPMSASRLEWYLLQFQPNGSLASDAHIAGTMEHLHCRTGRLVVRSGEREMLLETGDTARYAADVPHLIRNPDDAPAEAFLVMTSVPLSTARR